MNADAPPTKAQRFRALVEPAARRAGYRDYGGQARLSRDTGIPDSTLSRMFNGKAIPDVKSFPALAQFLGLQLNDLMRAAGIIPDPSLPESRPLQVRSVPTTPEEAAAALGIKSPVRVEMFVGMVEHLRAGEAAEEPDQDDELGGAAAGQQ